MPYRRSGGWANEFNSIRIPLSDFVAAGIQIKNIKSLTFLFGESYGSKKSRLSIDDIELIK